MEGEKVEATRAEKILAAAFVLFLLIGGVRVLSELREVPAKPALETFEARYGLPELNRNLSELSFELRSSEEAYQRAQKEFLKAKEEYLFKREEYRIALEEGSLQKELKEEYELAKQKYEASLRTRDATEEKLEAVRENFKALQKELFERRRRALEDYEDANQIYELKVLFIRLGFVIPLFIVSLYASQRARQRKSKYTIHANSFMAFSILLLVYMTLEFTWRSFHVLGVSTIGAFATGAALAYLKKEYFKTERVALERLSRGRCPYCSFPFESSDVYCRNCGKRLTETCDKCGAPRSRFARYCQYCGAKIKV